MADDDGRLRYDFARLSVCSARARAAGCARPRASAAGAIPAYYDADGGPGPARDIDRLRYFMMCRRAAYIALNTSHTNLLDSYATMAGHDGFRIRVLPASGVLRDEGSSLMKWLAARKGATM